MIQKHRRTRVLLLAALLVLAGQAAVADFDQAMNSFKAGKYVEAAADFQALVDQSPDYDFGHFMLGQCFMQMDKLADSEKQFRKAIELNGDRFDYHFALASADYKSKHFAEAISTLRTAEGLAAEAQKYQLYKLRGLAYVGLEKWGEAVDDLDRARTIKKTGPVLEQLGVAYYNLGHNDKAVPVLREALTMDAENVSLMPKLAKALMNLGAETADKAKKAAYYQESLQVAERYQRARPASYEAANLLGRAALGARDFPKAEQAFSRVLEIEPGYCYAMVNLGKVHSAQKQWAEAEEVLKRASECAPRMAVIYQELGFAVQKQRRLPDALEYYRKAMDIKPSASIQKMIEVCEKNLEIAEENQAIEQAEQAMEEAARAAEAEYEEAKQKQEEWKRRTERDD